MSDVEPDAVVAVLREMDKPAATLTELADRLGTTKPNVWEHQDRLEQDERLERDKAGRATIWYLADGFADETARDVWEQAAVAVADVLDADRDDLHRDEITRELAECYIGRDGLGSWRQNGEKA